MQKNIFDITNKVVVITGACGLLGKKHAEAVACFGGIPILIDLDQEIIDEMSANINKKYDSHCVGFAVDITNEIAIKNNVQIIKNSFNQIDALINNAANNPKLEDASEVNFSRLENFTIDNWNNDINVGLTGAFICAKHYGYEISKNVNGGTIINISSDLGIIAPDQRLYLKKGLSSDLQPVKPVSYSVAKAGLIGLTRYLSTYWISSNVRCNALCPGGIENDQPIEFLEKIQAKIPMNRLAKADEYQGTLIWMLSDAATYLNGAIIPVDGGRTSW